MSVIRHTVYIDGYHDRHQHLPCSYYQPSSASHHSHALNPGSRLPLPTNVPAALTSQVGK
jgi:hypothetical protein